MQRDILGVALLGVAVLTAITLFFPGGEVGRAWGSAVTQLFGWGSLVMAILTGVCGALLLRRSFEPSLSVRWQ